MAPAQELGEGRHGLSSLFRLGDDVITAVRLCSQQRDTTRSLVVRDNVTQAIIIAVSTALGVLVGALVVAERMPGMLMGGFLGLVAGFFVSGMLLMIMRALRRSRGGEA